MDNMQSMNIAYPVFTLIVMAAVFSLLLRYLINLLDKAS